MDDFVLHTHTHTTFCLWVGLVSHRHNFKWTWISGWVSTLLHVPSHNMWTNWHIWTYFLVISHKQCVTSRNTKSVSWWGEGNVLHCCSSLTLDTCLQYKAFPQCGIMHSVVGLAWFSLKYAVFPTVGSDQGQITCILQTHRTRVCF